MQDPTKTNPPAASDKKAMTAAEAARAVLRPVTTTKVVGKDDKGNQVTETVTKQVKVSANEVLDFKDYGTHVVVVTKDGQKFSSADEQ
ncbi:MAG: hypothetical protein V4573_17895 [Pseudomonadota bacterium]